MSACFTRLVLSLVFTLRLPFLPLFPLPSFHSIVSSRFPSEKTFSLIWSRIKTRSNQVGLRIMLTKEDQAWWKKYSVVLRRGIVVLTYTGDNWGNWAPVSNTPSLPSFDKCFLDSGLGNYGNKVLHGNGTPMKGKLIHPELLLESIRGIPINDNLSLCPQ